MRIPPIKGVKSLALECGNRVEVMVRQADFVRLLLLLLNSYIFLKNIIDGHGRFPKNLEGGPDMCFLVRNASQDNFVKK